MSNKNEAKKNCRKSLIGNLGVIVRGCAQTIGKSHVAGTVGIFFAVSRKLYTLFPTELVLLPQNQNSQIQKYINFSGRPLGFKIFPLNYIFPK